MADYHVTCHTPDNDDEDRRIQGLGGGGWWYSIDTIIRMIDLGHTFWVSVAGQRVSVIVRQHSGLLSSARYLTTEADGFAPNNLLNLDRCPLR